VHDASFQRIKIKSLRREMMTSLKPKAVGTNPGHNRHQMLQAVRVNDDNSYMTVFPQWQALHDEIKDEWEYFCNRIQDVKKT
jgi:hypothetical protein